MKHSSRAGRSNISAWQTAVTASCIASQGCSQPRRRALLRSLGSRTGSSARGIWIPLPLPLWGASLAPCSAGLGPIPKPRWQEWQKKAQRNICFGRLAEAFKSFRPEAVDRDSSGHPQPFFELPFAMQRHYVSEGATAGCRHDFLSNMLPNGQLRNSNEGPQGHMLLATLLIIKNGRRGCCEKYIDIQC